MMQDQWSGASGGGVGLPVNFTLPRRIIVGVILITALIAFEIFNFDTTRYALQDLLGDVSFMGLSWAVILAIAFCAIDFAGLARIFTPEQGQEEPKVVWYLMGAWLLGATMNAIMTWWAVNLTLLSHDFGNEVLSRAQLLRVVPLFVAVLVWLTRILFIGAFSMAGEHLFDGTGQRRSAPQMAQPARTQSNVRLVPNSGGSKYRPQHEDPSLPEHTEPSPTRVNRKPPLPGGGARAPMPAAMQARSRNRR